MYSTEIKAYSQLSSKVLSELTRLTHMIPELDRPQTELDLQQRLANKPCLVLLAYVEDELAGFKLGYAESDTVFYSWLGGVAPDFRNLGLAKSMLEYQEKWAAEQGYQTMTVKTRNHFKAMLTMLVRSQYQITEIAPAADIAHNKLHLQKQL
ncbi:GNAT family N-acetyltransferase [Shewanella sp. WXL01]|uniref:GNAT family N-acetyltransferase n=1 Tax=Shewanella maritima TaxID=2520507 RepID=A0A411PHU4_9GAMM|nr:MULTISPECIES: GNAT family N-acetyltransferase [Shewanella]NKF52034.1 GNAT family N-acetyltransferase [Shewanella sp. WXL01]QBF83167.1 GNAT family N-acetyltransferase [Shewanella maritima]